MENRIKIGDFVKLTGSTLKTIIYYHKIGLLPVPQRSAGGYRLYGAEDLNRMRLIKRLKSLGLDLKHIKEIIGDLQNSKTSREVLQSLRHELLNEKKTLEERLSQIDTFLNDDGPLLDEDSCDSHSFQMITQILGRSKLKNTLVPARKFMISTASCMAFWMIFSGVKITKRAFAPWLNISKRIPNNINWLWIQVRVGLRCLILAKTIPRLKLWHANPSL